MTRYGTFSKIIASGGNQHLFGIVTTHYVANKNSDDKKTQEMKEIDYVGDISGESI